MREDRARGKENRGEERCFEIREERRQKMEEKQMRGDKMR